ncbi:MAG: carboxypeptidase regulatory-like domain-containing protein [Myxococcales bacterium]|nr:carboxypeptidase regulatory-like domain-containing protein [Myxococcales bacterium]
MTKKTLALIGLALAGVAVVVWFAFGRRGHAPPPPPAPTAAPTAAPRTPSQAQPEAPSGPAPILARDADPAGPLLLEGQVLDDLDHPVAGAEVWVSSAPLRKVTTEADGSFAFDKLLGRTYAVGARRGDLVGGPVSTRVAADAEPVIIRLRLGATVKVTVHGDGADARPVAGAVVTLASITEPTATTDAAGVATFTGVDDGWTVASATAPGYAPATGTAVIGKTQRQVEIVLALRRGVAVSGTVVDQGGAPVAGAKVWPRDASSWEFTSGERTAVTTDAKGEFAIATVAPGSYRLAAKDEAHAPGTSPLVTVADDRPTTGVRIVLAAAGRLAGTVVDGDGAPAPYATVRVSGTEWSNDMVNRQAAADDRGQFVVEGLPRAPVRIRAESEVAASKISDVDLAATPDRKDLRLVLDQAGRIAGIVVDRAGAPVPEASVSAVPDFLADDRSRSDLILASSTATTTDGGGRFVLRGLEDGSYRLAASREGHGERAAWGSGSTSVRAGATDVRLVLPTPGGLRGTIVLDTGKAPSLAIVAAGWEHRVTTRDGRFELGGMNPGRFDLRVTGPDFAELVKGDLVVTDGEITDVGAITVTAGRKVTGRVVDGKGAPVEGARVLVGKMLFGDGKTIAADPDASGQAGIRSATTDADGAFAVRGISKDGGLIIAEHASRGRSLSMEVPRGAVDVTDLKLTVRGYGSLVGTVTRKGQPVSGATVNAAPIGSSGQAVFVQSGADGKFVLDKVPEGPTSVQAMQTSMMSAVSASRTVTVIEGRPTDASIDIPAGDVALTVKVEAEPGATVNAAWLLLMRGAFAATNGKQLMDAFLASNGAATGGAAGMEIWLGTATFPTFDELMPGSYSVCAIPITGSLMDRQLMDRVQANLDKLAAVCKGVTLPANPKAQRYTLSLPSMTPLPAPDAEPDAGVPAP